MTKPPKLLLPALLCLTMLCSSCAWLRPAPQVVVQYPQVPQVLLVPPQPPSLIGQINSYIRQLADARKSGTAEADVIDSLAQALRKVAIDVEPSLLRLQVLQDLVKTWQPAK